MNIAEASRRIVEIHFKCIESFALIRRLREVCQDGLNTSMKRAYRRGFAMPEILENMGFVIPDKAKLSSPKVRTQFGDGLARSLSVDAQTAVDSASIIFAHSALDACATDLCKLMVEIAPCDFEARIANKKITLAELKNLNGYEGVRESVLRAYIRELAKNSLSERLELINQKCQPVPKPKFDGRPYTFDLGRIQALDRERQAIIHRLEFRTPGERTEDEVDYAESQLSGYNSNRINCLEESSKSFWESGG
jgi:hypothetical protein